MSIFFVRSPIFRVLLTISGGARSAEQINSSVSLVRLQGLGFDGERTASKSRALSCWVGEKSEGLML